MTKSQKAVDLIQAGLNHFPHVIESTLRCKSAFGRVTFLESQRDSATDPRVARNELPWARDQKDKTPTGFRPQNNVCFVSQPRRGCWCRRFLPRVARASQPWASG